MRWPVESVAQVVITTGVGVVGMAAGFTHTHDAAVANGQSGWIAWAVAVVVECMAIVGWLHFIADRRAGRDPRFPASVVGVSFLVQMGAQVSGAPMTFGGWLFAALPSLACLVCVKLWMRTAHQAKQVSTSVSTEVLRSDVDRAPVPQIEADPEETATPDPTPQRITTWPPQAA